MENLDRRSEINISKIIPTKVNHLELVKAKLNYYRSISLMDGGIIIEFWKIEQKEGEPKQTPKSRNAEKELAFLTFDKERKLFKVSYYSINDGIQIKENITIDKLPEIIQTLKEAGF